MVTAHGCKVVLSTAESMVDIHDNVGVWLGAEKKRRMEAAEKGRNEKKGEREAKKHRTAMAVWSHRYPAKLHDPRSASAYRSFQILFSSLRKIISLRVQDA